MLAALIFAALVATRVDTMSARSAPCSVGLARIERQIPQSQSNPPLEGPPVARTVGAQCHHQRTSGAVKSAECRANADFQIALASEANARGDAAGCARALNSAREL
jgi:hypothetical protein